MVGHADSHQFADAVSLVCCVWWRVRNAVTTKCVGNAKRAQRRQRAERYFDCSGIRISYMGFVGIAKGHVSAEQIRRMCPRSRRVAEIDKHRGLAEGHCSRRFPDKPVSGA